MANLIINSAINALGAGATYDDTKKKLTGSGGDKDSSDIPSPQTQQKVPPFTQNQSANMLSSTHSKVPSKLASSSLIDKRTEVEKRFKKEAMEMFYSAFPSLSKYVLVMKVEDLQEDEGSGVGAIILVYGDDVIKVPVLLVSGVTEIFRMVYFSSNKILPLVSDLVSDIERKNIALDGIATRQDPKNFSTINVRDMFKPPIDSMGFTVFSNNPLSIQEAPGIVKATIRKLLREDTSLKDDISTVTDIPTLDDKLKHKKEASISYLLSDCGIDTKIENNSVKISSSFVTDILSEEHRDNLLRYGVTSFNEKKAYIIPEMEITLPQYILFYYASTRYDPSGVEKAGTQETGKGFVYTLTGVEPCIYSNGTLLTDTEIFDSGECPLVITPISNTLLKEDILSLNPCTVLAGDVVRRLELFNRGVSFYKQVIYVPDLHKGYTAITVQGEYRFDPTQPSFIADDVFYSEEEFYGYLKRGNKIVIPSNAILVLQEIEDSSNTRKPYITSFKELRELIFNSKQQIVYTGSKGSRDRDTLDNLFKNYDLSPKDACFLLDNPGVKMAYTTITKEGYPEHLNVGPTPKQKYEFPILKVKIIDELQSRGIFEDDIYDDRGLPNTDNDIILDAIQVNNPEILDLGLISSVLITNDMKVLLLPFIPTFELSTTHLGLVILVSSYNRKALVSKKGEAEYSKFIGSLNKLFVNFGQMVFDLQRVAGDNK